MKAEGSSDRPKITDWITGIATVVLVVITIVYVRLTYDMLGQGKSQLALSQDPQIAVAPEEDVHGQVGEFDLSLRNLGLSEITDIRIYEDYFVSLTVEGGPIRFTRFGIFSVKPNSVIQSIAPNDSANFHITFKSIYKDMTTFFFSDVKGHRMMIARLRVKFRRALDGKEFTKSKAYIIAGNGDYLIDHDERGIPFPGGPSFSDMKEVLGIQE